MRNHDFHRALGKRITALRKEFELTQAELARVLGVSQQTVFAFELGDRRISIDKVPLLTRTFGMSADQLLGIVPVPSLPRARTSPAELRLVEQVRSLSMTDRRVVRRVAEALKRSGRSA